MEQSKFYQIKNITEHEYTLVGCDGSVITRPIKEIDKSASSFTIQDVKDGDVLAYKDEISLYKHDIKNRTKQETTFGGFVYHCCYDGKRFIMDSLYSLTEQDKMDIHPATKEQRDMLFQKMHEAGYEWDADRKGLRKIENEIEIPFGAKDSELQEVTYYIPQGFHAEIDDNKVVIKKGEKPTAWSEEDERTLQGIWDEILANKHNAEEYEWETYDKFLTWLKSLRPQPKHGWSEEDEDMFNGVIETEQYMLDVVYGRKIFAVGNEDLKEECTKELAWLKSLKDRIK